MGIKKIETKMEKLQEVKEFLLKRRNLENANLQENAIEEDGYLDAQDYSGGNFDDCLQLGIEIGEAELIEEILFILNK